MAKIVKFADRNKIQPSPKPKIQSLLVSYLECLSEIDKLIENHINKISCQ